jgi:glycyl-tRNA synthetase beta subunit
MSLPFLLEIGAEEIPDWMIPTALENLHLLFEKLDLPHESVTLDATPRRLVLRVEGLPERQADSQERILGPAKSAPPPNRRLRKPSPASPASRASSLKTSSSNPRPKANTTPSPKKSKGAPPRAS